MELPKGETMRFVVCGSGRHGKDTVCEYLRDQHNLTFVSSSWFLAERVIWPKIGDRYASLQACYDDRHNHRELWYNLIAEYNQPNAARLGLEIFAQYNVYCGLRNREELIALRSQLPVTVLWVDRSQHCAPEPSSSLTITEQDAEYTLDNNHTLTHLYDQIDNLIQTLGYADAQHLGYIRYTL